MLTGIGTPSEPPIRGREEKLAEVGKGKMPVTGGNCTPLLFPVGGSQSSKLMASASLTAHQSAFAGNSNWKVAQYAQKQHDTYVAKCPSSHGLDQILLHQMSEMQKHQMSEMQKQLQSIVDNINPMIQMSVAAALTRLGFFPQTNAPIVFPAEPYHDPLSMQGGTNAAAVSSGGPTTQSSPHNGELECKVYKAFCEMPVIIDMFRPFSEDYMRRINEASLDLEIGVIDEGIEDQETKENLKKIDEDLMGTFFRKWQELFKKFSEEGPTEKFEAICLKVKEEEERQWRETRDKFFEECEDYGPNHFSEEYLQLLGHRFLERGESSGTAPPADHSVANMAANTSQLQIATTGTNNVEQEDNFANLENDAAEADNQGMDALLPPLDLGILEFLPF